MFSPGPRPKENSHHKHIMFKYSWEISSVVISINNLFSFKGLCTYVSYTNKNISKQSEALHGQAD